MFNKIQGILVRTAIIRGLKKNAPDRFPLSKENDYYTVTLEGEKPFEGMLVSELSNGRIHGKVWDEATQRYAKEGAIELVELESRKLVITRFYGYAQIVYSGATEFWWAELTLRPQRFWFRQIISQTAYELRTRFRHDRIDLLKSMISFETSSDDDKTSSGLLHTPTPKSINQLMAEVYGNRVYSHPRFQQEAKVFRLLVDSLVATGDLEKADKHSYSLAPKALATIADFELSERRHQDSKCHNRILILLTSVLAVTAIVQAVSTFF